MKFIISVLVTLLFISCTKKSDLAESTTPATSAPAEVQMPDQDLPDPSADLPTNAPASVTMETATPSPSAKPSSAEMATSSAGTSPAPAKSIPLVLKINLATKDRACKKDSDCVKAATHCSCDCGSAVNKAHAKKYRQKWAAACAKDKDQKMCKIHCNGEVKCVKKVCTYI